MKTLRRAAVLVLLLVMAAATAQQLCEAPPPNGTSLSGVLNTYYAGVNGTVSKDSKSIPVDNSPRGPGPGIAAGDLLLVIQMQDAAINYSNNGSYGDGQAGDPATGSNDYGSTGYYEFVTATGPVASGRVPIAGGGPAGGLLNSYYGAAATSSRGQRTYQVIRVPRYFDAQITGTVQAEPWDGKTGGVVALDVVGRLTFSGSGRVDVSGQGFRGGGGRQLTGGTGGSNTAYVSLSTSNYHGSKGEGAAGTPRYVLDGTTVTSTGNEGYPGGSMARGAPANAGGGGTDANPGANDQNSGGGGGANGGAGGKGGDSWSSGRQVGGFGGSPVPSSGHRLVLGGGGGAGTRNNSSGAASSGGAGGGIVLIRAGQISGQARIDANGADGVEPENDAGGGGGAGGSVLVVAGSATGHTLTVNARGGRGANADIGGDTHGPGGGGGGGVVRVSHAATINVSGGSSGTTVNNSNKYGATDGAAGRQTTSATADAFPGVVPASPCPTTDLKITKAVNVSGSSSVAPGDSVTYTITVTNDGGVDVAGATVVDVMPASLEDVTWQCTAGCSASGTGDINLLLDLGANQSATIVVTAKLKLGDVGSRTDNIAEVVAPQDVHDPDPSNNTGSARFTHASVQTGFVITKTVDDPTPHVGNEFTFSISAAFYRSSGGTATNVTITDELPAGLEHVTSSGQNCSASYSQAARRVTCTAPAGITPTSPPLTLTITARVAASVLPETLITNTATITGVRVTSNNRHTSYSASSSATVTVAGFTLDKAVRNVTAGEAFSTSSQGAPGETLEYRLLFTPRVADVTNLVLTDTIPEFTDLLYGAYEDAADTGDLKLTCPDTTVHLVPLTLENGGFAVDVSAYCGATPAGQAGEATFQVVIR